MRESLPVIGRVVPPLVVGWFSITAVCQAAAPAARPDQPAAQRRPGDVPPHHALSGFYGQAEGNLSLVAQSAKSDAPGVFVRTFAVGLRGGHRWGNKALFATAEADFWRSPLLDEDSELVMAVNAGIGGEILAVNGLLRTSLALGPSILAIPTEVDDGGEVGFFVDLRPLGLRFQLTEPLLLGVDPLSFNLVMPVLSGIPLVEIEYRSAIYVEHRF